MSATPVPDGDAARRGALGARVGLGLFARGVRGNVQGRKARILRGSVKCDALLVYNCTRKRQERHDMRTNKSEEEARSPGESCCCVAYSTVGGCE